MVNPLYVINFFISGIPMGYIITWVYLVSDRSILACMIFHMVVNLLQEKIDSYLLEYNSDSVLKTLSDEVNNMFSNWIGNYVDGLDIQFVRDTNVDGADILVCYVEVTFRGLILRVPIIVNVAARQ